MFFQIFVAFIRNKLHLKKINLRTRVTSKFDRDIKVQIIHVNLILDLVSQNTGFLKVYNYYEFQYIGHVFRDVIYYQQY